MKWYNSYLKYLGLGVLITTLLLVLIMRQYLAEMSSQNSLRFRTLGYKFVSLDENPVIDLYSLDLTDYHFPNDYPFVVQDEGVYLKVNVDNQTLYLETDFKQENLWQYCTPNNNFDSLLCTVNDAIGDIGVEDDEIDNLLTAIGKSQIVRSLIREQIINNSLYKRFFVINTNSRDIYVLPERDCGEICRRIFKTGCYWLDDREIACQTGHGTDIWSTEIFDLSTKSFRELPGDGSNLWVYDNYYLQYNYSSQHTIYNLMNTPVYTFTTDNRSLLTQKDSIAFIEPCETSSLCFRHLKFDETGVIENMTVSLQEYFPQNSQCSFEDVLGHNTFISNTSDTYIVTACGTVFFVSRDNLQVTQSFELLLGEDSKEFVVFVNENFVVAEIPSILPRSQQDEVFVDYSVILFDLTICEEAFSPECVFKAWSTDGRQQRSKVYYLPFVNPNLFFTIDSNQNSVTIYNLKTRQEMALKFANKPELTGLSDDGLVLLVSTQEEEFTSPAKRQYHLIDLNKGEFIKTKINVGQNFILVREVV